MNAYTCFLLVQLAKISAAAWLPDNSWIKGGGTASSDGKGSSGAFNPLDPAKYSDYKPTGWDTFLSEGALSASTADYQGADGKACVRVVTFMAYGAVLDNLETECDTPATSAGLHIRDSAIRYYDLALARQESAGHFSVVKRVDAGYKCNKKLYQLGECKNRCPSPAVQKEAVSTDISCFDLDETSVPPMHLLSSKGDTKDFPPVGEDWLLFNVWENLGFVSREYKKNHKCFRLLVVYSRGRRVHGAKLTCGPLSDITSTDRSLRVEKTLLVTEGSSNQYIFLFNHRNSHCSRMIVGVKGTAESEEKEVISDDFVTLKDNECYRLAMGWVTDRTVDDETVKRLKKTPLKDIFTNEILKPYVPTEDTLDINLGREMGLTVQTFTRSDNRMQSRLVTLTARGVPLLPVIEGMDVPKEIIVERDMVYYGRDIVFVKQFGVNSYQITKRLDEGHCWRKQYALKDPADDQKGFNPFGMFGGGNQNQPTEKPIRSVQELEPKNRQPNILNDKECEDLVKGRHLRSLSVMPGDKKQKNKK